jgi:hypothetical protein
MCAKATSPSPVSQRRRDRHRAADTLRLAEALETRDLDRAHRLIELGITAETLPAFEALPFVAVAWADGHVDREERWCVLEEATAFGLELGSPAHALLESWLAKPPRPALLDAWALHAAGVYGDARGPAALQRRRLLLGMDRVASAAGGLLGLRAVSGAERRAIARLSEVLGRPAARAA